MLYTIRMTLRVLVGLAFGHSAYGQTTWHVDDDTCPAVGNGSQVDPYCSIQIAIDASTNGDAIQVANGTYVELINFNGKAVSLRSASDNPATTIIDGDSDGPIVTCNSGGTSTTLLRGLTITNGQANRGGGMNISSASPTVINCVFRQNFAFEGGAVYNNFADVFRPQTLTFSNCVFEGNVAQSSGAAMLNRNSSSPVLANCQFVGNRASNGAGILNDRNCSPIVTNCIFSGNEAGLHGGGMLNVFLSSPILTNCTFSGNSAFDSRGALGNLQSSDPVLTNCILWDNGPLAMTSCCRSNPTISNSIIQDGLPMDTIDGGGNIDINPLFVDPNGADEILGTVDDDFRLLPGSPAIDAGNNSAVPVGVMTDFDGHTRFVDDILTVDTGVGIAPIVDIGAFEFVLGDCDADGDADIADHVILDGCLTSPGDGLGVGCACLDLDADGDVDLRDFGYFQMAFIP